jgi:hypothetical protein
MLSTTLTRLEKLGDLFLKALLYNKVVLSGDKADLTASPLNKRLLLTIIQKFTNQLQKRKRFHFSPKYPRKKVRMDSSFLDLW